MTLEQFLKAQPMAHLGPRQQVMGTNGLRYRVVKGELVRIKI